jgi:argininosuccinate lyase
MQQIQALPYEITLITNNLSGYHRDLQLLKKDCFHHSKPESLLRYCNFLHKRHQSKDNILADQKYNYLFTVDTKRNGSCWNAV